MVNLTPDSLRVSTSREEIPVVRWSIAQGELIGLACDGNWKFMAGDFYYNPKYNKCVHVDIRFVLWIIDKYGRTSNLLNEINIVE